ncbi:uncharacterized protein EI90DRAFT_3053938 [Cantharellus anzutake]|uniref:uncharacterized protein n=1 Tax=Cantharellus anzutake TaxID=1750568 RepID=UPI001905EAEE|nr:uncharacterized protein EI90DRAFT_3053938 [Cantharellus anzutake]KAF8332660.1 hypothetical protein EI90DRAFT_3053938 [Cantharellus anzutake]
MIVSLSDHGDPSGDPDLFVSEDGTTLFGDKRIIAGESGPSDSSITRVEANRIAQTWTQTGANPWLKWGIAVLGYILVLLAAFLLSFQKRYETIVTTLSWAQLDDGGGVGSDGGPLGGTATINAGYTSEARFPMLLLLVDITNGARWDTCSDVFVSSGNAWTDAMDPPSSCDFEGHISQQRVGNYDTYLLDFPSMSNCSVSAPSQYLRIIATYDSEANDASIMGVVFPPATPAEVIYSAVGNDGINCVLHYIPEGGRTVGTISPSTTVHLNGTKRTDYTLNLQWVPPSPPYVYYPMSSTFTVSTTSTSYPYTSSATTRTHAARRSIPTKGQRAMIPAPVPQRRGSDGIMDLSLRYESFLQPVSTEKRQMNRVDIVFECLALLGVMSVMAQVIDAVAFWWKRRWLCKKEHFD